MGLAAKVSTLLKEVTMVLTGNPIDYLIAFAGGILVSLTPCIYPLIPITAGYIGVKGGSSKPKAAVLGLIYVTGIAITYSILGIVASLTGAIFGQISTHPLTRSIVGVIIVVFGLSMAGAFTIRVPDLALKPKLKRENYLSTFFLGLSSGLLVSPCLTPVLGSILFYLSTKRNVFYGATLLFSFACGMGLLLILIGISSAMIINLPKAGKWMLWVKRFSAILLIGIGLFFIYNAIRSF